MNKEMKNRKSMARMAVIILLAASAAANWGMAVQAGVKQFQAQTLNHLETGNIKIELKEYRIMEDGTETDYFYDGEVVPGTYVSKIPRIHNLSSDCYVRIKTEYPSKLKLEDGNLKGISDDWIKRGEYWYYQPVLEEEESVDFFTGIQFPADWDEEQAGQDILLALHAEAIQAVNFTPDYTRDDPWFGEQPQHCLQEFGVKGGGMGSSPMYVIYEDQLSVSPIDFFQNLGTLMPGDQRSDSFAIENKNAEEAEIWFRTELPELSDKQREVLDGMALTIQKGGEILYQGNLAAGDLEQGVSLGKALPGGHMEVSFSISVPKEWENAYAFRDTAVKWIFETQRIIPDPSPPTGEETKNQGWIYFSAGTVSFLVLLAVLAGKKSKAE